jgi:two-component system NarL family sensor kinase
LRKSLIYFFALALLFWNFNLLSQTKEIDSIKNVIKTAKNDTSVARAYLNLTKIIFASNPDTLLPTCNKVISIVDKNIGSCNAAEKHSYLISKAAAFSNIGIVYYQKGMIDTSVVYLEKGLKIQEELGEKQEIANSLNSIGAVYLNSGKTDMALVYFLKGLKSAREIGSNEIIAYTLGNIGYVYDNWGQTKLALDYYYEALKKQEENKNDLGIGSNLNNIAAIFMKQGDYEKALEYFNKSIKAREKFGDKRGVAQCLNNIGALFIKSNRAEKALDYFIRSKKIYEEINHKAGIAYSVSNMATVYKTLGQSQKALDLYYQGLKLHEEVDDKKGLTTCLNNISICLLKESNPAKALEYANRALEVAETSKNAEGIRDAYSTLSDINKALGKSPLALEYYKKHILFRDSIINQDARKASVKKQLQYDYEKRAEADKLELQKKEAIHREELKRQKLIYWSVFGTVALALLSIILLFNRNRLKEKNKFQLQLNEQQKEQANAVMETQESERKRIAEDLHDSLGHLLSTAKLNLQTQPIAQKQIDGSLNLLNQASEEIRNITFNLMPRTLEEGGLIPALNELASKVTNSGAVKVLLHVHDMEKFVLEKQSQFNIYRIVQEAVNNILKHAAATEINIQVLGQKDHITIMIEDDGKGFNPETNKEGRGLKNIVTRSLWLKGNINIDSTPGRGTTITTEFPI